MKKIVFITLLLTLPFLASRSAAQMKTIDACTLISPEQINKMLGTSVTETHLRMKGYCNYPAPGGKVLATITATPFTNNKAAGKMLKTNYDNYSADIAHGKKALAVYDQVKPFPAGGENAHVLTSPGDASSPAELVRLQFVSGNALITFDMKGADRNKVSAKLPEIYKIIAGNYK